MKFAFSPRTRSSYNDFWDLLFLSIGDNITKETKNELKEKAQNLLKMIESDLNDFLNSNLKGEQNGKTNNSIEFTHR